MYASARTYHFVLILVCLFFPPWDSYTQVALKERGEYAQGTEVVSRNLHIIQVTGLGIRRELDFFFPLEWSNILKDKSVSKTWWWAWVLTSQKKWKRFHFSTDGLKKLSFEYQVWFFAFWFFLIPFQWLRWETRHMQALCYYPSLFPGVSLAGGIKSLPLSCLLSVHPWHSVLPHHRAMLFNTSLSALFLLCCFDISEIWNWQQGLFSFYSEGITD